MFSVFLFFAGFLEVVEELDVTFRGGVDSEGCWSLLVPVPVLADGPFFALALFCRRIRAFSSFSNSTVSNA